VNHKTFVIMFMLQKNKLVFIYCIHFYNMSLLMVAIKETMDYSFARIIYYTIIKNVSL